MNQEKIGKFIADCRKEKNFTQEQLAEKLGVSNKSVSRWENGRTLPDYSVLDELANLFEVSLTELYYGEKLSEENRKEKWKENIVMVAIDMDKVKRKLKKISRFILYSIIILPIIILIGCLTFILIQEYRYQKILLAQETAIAQVCQSGNHTLRITIESQDGKPAYVDSSFGDGILTYTLYQTKDLRLMEGSHFGATYTIKLQPRGIENSIFQVPEEIYYYSKLLWKKGMEIPMCEENM